MIKFYSFLDKHILTYEAFMTMFILLLTLGLMKTTAEIDKLKSQAINHGFAKYDETKGNWRWVNEEDMLH
jgi:hypothetical protein